MHDEHPYGNRKIIHVDMDAFYASVEQRDQPHLKGKPVVVGGKPDSRGVVAAASYEARKYGIRSAMPCARAAKLCPDAIFVKPRFDAYRAASQQIRGIFQHHTDLIEPLSLDEAYLDVTENKQHIELASDVARRIRQQIQEETRLTASAGIAPNKFLAKIASDLNKPNGQAVIPPEKIPDFLATLPVGRIFGIGPVTRRKLEERGIHTAADLQTIPLQELVAGFGKAGQHYFNISRGIDHRHVEPNRKRKSVSAEETFASDYDDLNWLRGHLMQIAERVASRLQRAEATGRTITLKVKYDDFQQVTRSRSLDRPVDDVDTLIRVGCDLLHETEAGSRKVRLLGLGVSNLDDGDETPPEQGPQIRLPL